MARKTAPDSAAPRKKRFARLRQIGQVFNQSRRMDPTIPWWMLGAFVAVVAVFFVVGLILHRPVYFTILGVPLGVLAAGILMARKAERAAYKQLEGQVGGGGAALGALRKGWYYDQQPVAIEGTRPGDLNAAAMVFRAVGRSCPRPTRKTFEASPDGVRSASADPEGTPNAANAVIPVHRHRR